MLLHLVIFGNYYFIDSANICLYGMNSYELDCVDYI